MIGLSGAHRTGKTTLAKAYAKKNEVKFLETRASSVFKDMGLDPATTYDFSTRLSVQEEILRRFEKEYAKQVGGIGIITDRTPLDLLAYTLAEAVGDNVKGDDENRLMKYASECFRVFNSRFSVLLLVQPGIPMVAEEGKAALNAAYQEHLNAIIFGFMVGERVKVPCFFVPRSNTDLDERVALVERTVGRVVDRAERDIQAMSLVAPLMIQ